MKDDADKPALEYEQRGSAQLHRQYRRLMALTLLNTILLAGFIVGPSVGPFVRTQWEQFQHKRAERQAQARARAAFEAGKTYTAPADRVVYEERPEEASKLLGVPPGALAAPGAAYVTIRDFRSSNIYFTPNPWQPPVVFNDPALPTLKPLSLPVPLVFLHTRDSGSGANPLVVVALGMHQSVDPASPTIDVVRRRNYQITTSRRLVAYCQPDEKTTAPATELRLGRDEPRTHVAWLRSSEDNTWEHGQVEYDKHGLFRIYAGQIDPNDAAHFTIDYELDGVRGTLDGRLRADNCVELTPRGGTIVERDSGGLVQVWDPFIAPTTRPGSR